VPASFGSSGGACSPSKPSSFPRHSATAT
jgi:hypothetical protein